MAAPEARLQPRSGGHGQDLWRIVQIAWRIRPVAVMNIRRIQDMADSMHTVTGGCYCGSVLVNIRLSREPASYNPRACDCGFCRKHGAAYISDARGSLEIEIGAAEHTGRYRQGSETADCLFCRRCGVLVGVTCEIDGCLYGTVNVRSLDAAALFGPQQPVSPQQLSATEKLQRWQGLWFPTRINIRPHAREMSHAAS